MMTPSLQPKRRARGLTLVELLFAVGVGSILLAGVASLSLYGARSFAALGNFADVDAGSRQALDLLSRELRQASAVLELQTNMPVKWLSVTTNSAFGVTAKVTWDSEERTLTLTAHQRNHVLLKECDFWEARLLSRVPNVGATNFSFTSSTTLTDCKAIEMSWKCSRTNQGQHLNTESLQRSHIVIRNKIR